jgi:hypothetical protein
MTVVALTRTTDDNDAEGWFFPMDKDKYHPYIASLMGFIHGQQTPYAKTKILLEKK